MNKMKIYLLISNTNDFSILFAWCVLLLLHTHSVQAEPISQDCPNTANYTSNSQFETNLNILLPSLLSNGTQDGFFNTSVGTGSDIVYGLVQCRGDISTEQCRNCLNTSIVEVFQRCPNVKQAVLRYEYCFLRYSDAQFFSRVDGPLVAAGRGDGQVSDTVANRYNQQLGSFLVDLFETAASTPSRYSSGSTSYADFNNIYGLVQCTRDLSTNDCASCLESLRNWIPGCCNRTTGAQIFQKTCYLRVWIISEYSKLLLHDAGDATSKSTNIVVIVVPIIVATWKLWREGNALQLVDPTLQYSFTGNQVIRCIHIGLLCVQENVEDRPTMSSVCLMLSSYSITPEPPKAPAFTLVTRTAANDSKSSSSLLYSDDGITYPR
ncbi:Protein kinase domain [Artemisia annua]|uniref:Protein kinase domain n=1 Tax=Artemisia annua TaxID=35608 RepID=A0A2U1L1Q8_ARTAN|nr:Protein kinase domain [Artemisia annua]